MAVKKPTQDLRDKQLREFESYLLRYTGRDLRTFIPGDFESYFGGQWVHQHCQAGKLPSNSSVDSLISNLGIEVSLLGREGRWSQLNGQGELAAVGTGRGRGGGGGGGHETRLEKNSGPTTGMRMLRWTYVQAIHCIAAA
jgi:hypothetical protein